MVLQVTLKRKAVTEDTICPKEAKYFAMLENKRQFMKGAGERTRNKQKLLDEEERTQAWKNDNKSPFTEVHVQEQERTKAPSGSGTVKSAIGLESNEDIICESNISSGPVTTNPTHEVKTTYISTDISQTLSYEIPNSLQVRSDNLGSNVKL